MKRALGIFIFAACVALASNESGMSPTAVLQEFLVAVIKGDKEHAQQFSLPNPEFDLLFEMKGKTLEEQKRQIKTLTASPYQILQDGESFVFQGRSITAGPELTKIGWVLLFSAKDPIPHFLKKTDKGWQVDPITLIAVAKYNRSKKPNQASEPTRLRVTPRADARVAPLHRVAHL